MPFRIPSEAERAAWEPLVEFMKRKPNHDVIGCMATWARVEIYGRDNCSVCHGGQGGVPGNENIIDGKTVCDYCSVEMLKLTRAK